MKTLKQIVQIAAVLFISGLEPFWPLGSPILALAAVLGTKYPNSRGIIIVVLIGLVRDALLVNRLGVSPLIGVFAWFIAALTTARLGRPSAAAVVSAAIAALPAITLAAADGPFSYQYILATAALAGVFSLIWNFISERDDAIKIKSR